MKKILYAVIIVLLIAIVAVKYNQSNSQVNEDNLPSQNQMVGQDSAVQGQDNIVAQDTHSDDSMENDKDSDDSDSEMTQSLFDENDEVVEFTLGGENFKFTMDGEDNPDLVVNEGDNVRIIFSSTSGFHDWVLDEFDAATKQVRPENGVTIVEFVADEAGEYEYYCSVGSHRANGMVGNFIVE